MLTDINFKQEVTRFFEGGKQGFNALRPVVIELDRHLARKFNFFNSIGFFDSISQKREDRLSDVFEYLLDPDGSHGQRDLFLREFLEDVDVEWLRESNWSFSGIAREVYTTRIKNWQRKIDIEIVFKINDVLAAIAIENKPWVESTDETGQLRDYAQHLQRMYEGSFKLIYLTPCGGNPSENSICRAKREKLVKAGKFANASIQDWVSDKGWLKRAEDGVKAERVRWFVSDFRTALKDSLCHPMAGG